MKKQAKTVARDRLTKPIVLTMRARVTFELDPNVVGLVITEAIKTLLKKPEVRAAVTGETGPA
jgi:hypothetical protein